MTKAEIVAYNVNYKHSLYIVATTKSNGNVHTTVCGVTSYNSQLSLLPPVTHSVYLYSTEFWPGDKYG